MTFNLQVLQTKLAKYCRKFVSRDSSVILTLIEDFKSFCSVSVHQLLVIEADKNAGICIVNQRDYNNEVLRQLNDLSTFHPSTRTAFELDMVKYIDHVSIFSKSLLPEYNINKFKFKVNLPANFYIMPKVYKPFDKFPKGRPTSSTYRKDKYASKLLYLCLRPALMEVEDLLIDTQHFLLELGNVRLQPNIKYIFATVDV